MTYTAFVGHQMIYFKSPCRMHSIYIFMFFPRKNTFFSIIIYIKESKRKLYAPGIAFRISYGHPSATRREKNINERGERTQLNGQTQKRQRGLTTFLIFAQFKSGCCRRKHFYRICCAIHATREIKKKNYNCAHDAKFSCIYRF